MVNYALSTANTVGTGNPPGDANTVHGFVNKFDTAAASATVGQVLMWNGTAWMPTTLSPATPAPAASAGFNSLVFSDEFTTLSTVNTGTTADSTKKWANYVPFDATPLIAGSTFTQGSWTDSNGVTSPDVLTITPNKWNYNQSLYTVDARNGSGFSKQYGYFEARFCHAAQQVVSGVTEPTTPAAAGIADTPAAAAGWPSFWSLAKRHLLGTELTTSVPTPSAIGYFELDFHEYYLSAAQNATYGNILTGTVHDWHGGNDYRNTDGNQYPTDMSHIGDPAAWHIYGCLWKPGQIIWYLDGAAKMSLSYSASAAPSPNNVTTGYVMPSGTFNIANLDTQGVALALGSGNGYPMHIDWVRVWG